MKCTPTQLIYEKLHCAGITPNDIPAHFKPGSGASLPFTGFDIAFVVLAGLFLIVLGFSLRRIGRNA